MELFADQADEGEIFIASIAASGGVFSEAVDLSPYEGLKLTATLTDADGNTSPFSAATLIPDLTPPQINLIGAQAYALECGATYDEPGATATDNVDGDLSASIQITGSVDETNPGEYLITYSLTDHNGNNTEIIRTVTVADTIPPVLTLVDSPNLSVAIGSSLRSDGRKLRHANH